MTRPPFLAFQTLTWQDMLFIPCKSPSSLKIEYVHSMVSALFLFRVHPCCRVSQKCVCITTRPDAPPERGIHAPSALWHELSLRPNFVEPFPVGEEYQTSVVQFLLPAAAR